ncbi:MAG: 30S ribosomal protein S17 [Brevinema sp.]
MTKQKTFTGVVASDKMNKSRTIVITTHEKHPLYKKYVPKRKKLMVHDEQNTSALGDKVLIGESTPHSKCKRWVLLEVLEKHQV